MVREEIAILCSGLKKRNNLLNSEDVMGDALDLGNIYDYMQSASNEDKALLNDTLIGIKERLTSNRIQEIWDEINSKAIKNFRECDGVKKPLEYLKREMISDFFYLRSISAQSLVQFGQNDRWYRFVMIGLIRKHIVDAANEEIKDPFFDFNYHLLEEVESKEDSSILTPFISQCGILPIQDIFALGENDATVARLVLNDLIGTMAYYQLGSLYAAHHAILRPWIAKKWQEYLKMNTQTSQIQSFLIKEIRILSERFPEFKDIDSDPRQKREGKSRGERSSTQNQDNASKQSGGFSDIEMGFAATGIFYAVSVITRAALPALGITNPCVAFSAAVVASFGYIAFKRRMTEEDTADTAQSNEETSTTSANQAAFCRANVEFPVRI